MATLTWNNEAGAKYLTVLGTGRVLWILWYVDTATERDNFQPRIRVDDVAVDPISDSITNYWLYYFELCKAGVFFGQYDTTNGRYCLIWLIPLEFSHKLEIGAAGSFIGTLGNINISYGASLVK